MKISKKLRFLFSLTSLIVCLCMSTVLVSADTYEDMMQYAVEETTTSAEDAKTYANGKITLGEAKSLAEQMVSAISQFAACSPEELDYIADVMSYQTDVYTNLAKAAGEDGCGAYVSHDNVRVEETEGNSVDVIADVHFENKDLKMILHVTCFDTIGAQVTSTEFSLADEGEVSFGAKMATAGSNTLVGMGVVFCVLIFISLIISCFGFIPKITEMIQNRNSKKHEVQVLDAVDTPVEVITAEEDNTELIAVIAAAIAASEQISTDSFVVRSIRRH